MSPTEGEIQLLTATILTSKLLSLPVRVTGMEISALPEMGMYCSAHCLLVHARIAFSWGNDVKKNKQNTPKNPTQNHGDYVTSRNFCCEKKNIYYWKLLPATSLLSSLFCQLRIRGSFECKTVKHLLVILKYFPSLGNCQRTKNRLEVENPISLLPGTLSDCVHSGQKIWYIAKKYFFFLLSNKKKNLKKRKKRKYNIVCHSKRESLKWALKIKSTKPSWTFILSLLVGKITYCVNTTN